MMIYRVLKFMFFFKFITIIYNFIVVTRARINYKNFAKINGRIFCDNKGTFTIGKNVKVNSGKSYNVIGGDVRANFIIKEEAILKIGNNVGISNSTFVCHNSIIIEDNVLFGGSCKVYDTDFHSVDVKNRMKPYLNNEKDETVNSLPIVIKQGAWIGGHCIILKGVTIGENSIVGAGAVVTKSIPKNEIWGGNPAKFIKKILE